MFEPSRRPHESAGLVTVTNSALSIAMSSIESSAVSSPFRDANRGLPSRRATYVV